MTLNAFRISELWNLLWMLATRLSMNVDSEFWMVATSLSFGLIPRLSVNFGSFLRLNA